MSVRRRILGPAVPKMPSGLLELMDGLARDVLKNSPENIYEFCARHMQTLLEIRDGRAIRPLMTLDEKIEIAQKKVQQRAEERRRAYDKQIAEYANEQEISSTLNTACGDDPECSEDKETDKKIIDVEPEQKGEITKVIEEQEIAKSAVLTSESKTQGIDANDVLNKDDVENIQENNNEDKRNLENLNDSDKNEKNNLVSQSEPETDDNLKNDNIENNLSQDIQPELTCYINITPNDNVAASLLVADAIQLETHDQTEEKNISPEDKDINLGNEGTEIIQNNGGTELSNEVETNMNITNPEMQFSDKIENAVSPSLDNFEENSNLGIDTEKSEKQIKGLSINNSLTGNNSETLINTEANHDLPDKQDKDLNKPEKSPDDGVLTVIVDSNNIENVPLQTTEPDITQPNELDSVEIIVSEAISNEVEVKTEKIPDIENVPEAIHDNDKTNNSSMDLETAAITIQKVFRSFLFKTKTASYDDPTTVDITLLTDDKEKEDNEILNIKDRRHLGISRMDTVLQTVNEEKSLSLSTDDSSTLSSAATIIQAHVRGFLVRNKINLNKTISSNSLIDSDAPSIPSLEADSDNTKSKTILNIHIVPEGGHFVSRDESILTSMDLSLDSSPPSSVNLHPLGYDKSERRKQLKREDAIQSVSPPSNNSGKLSEDHDSVKEVLITESNADMEQKTLCEKIPVEAHDVEEKKEDIVVTENGSNIDPIIDTASDEMDVITPFAEDKNCRESDNSTKLLHSGEFHDIVVPTNVTRSDTSVVRGE